ncbi:hypothetical protein AB0451_37450, partial [Streptomyces sp. NPDC052000]|uniref:hypothetical protein n=1 Tax=Streptomyces sp. NPDC052000 TaxID=3155676 RepID=UPI00344C545F
GPPLVLSHQLTHPAESDMPAAEAAGMSDSVIHSRGQRVRLPAPRRRSVSFFSLTLQSARVSIAAGGDPTFL